MCYKKPGPRCSPHERLRVQAARRAFNRAKAEQQAHPGPAAEQRLTDARKTLSSALRSWCLTPDGLIYHAGSRGDRDRYRAALLARRGFQMIDRARRSEIRALRKAGMWDVHFKGAYHEADERSTRKTLLAKNLTADAVRAVALRADAIDVSSHAVRHPHADRATIRDIASHTSNLDVHVRAQARLKAMDAKAAAKAADKTADKAAIGNVRTGQQVHVWIWSPTPGGSAADGSRVDVVAHVESVGRRNVVVTYWDEAGVMRQRSIPARYVRST